MSTPPEKEPNNKSFTVTDVFGFGKIIEKIPLQKINGIMAFTLTFVIILYAFMGYIYLNKTNPDDFPTAWDMRVFTASGIIIIVVIMFNYFSSKKTPN